MPKAAHAMAVPPSLLTCAPSIAEGRLLPSEAPYGIQVTGGCQGDAGGGLRSMVTAPLDALRSGLERREQLLEVTGVGPQVALTQARGGAGVDPDLPARWLQAHHQVVAKAQERGDHNGAQAILCFLDLLPAQCLHGATHALARGSQIQG